MNKELNLEIYDIVKITNGVGSIWIESISKMDKENYYTKGFKIDKQGNVESLYIKNINDAYQLEFVWRLDDNRNYIMIYPIQRLEAIDNANPSEVLERLENLKKQAIAFEHSELAIKVANGNADTIKQALLKTQEQEKVIIELCEYCGMDNLYPYDNLEEIEITFKETFDNYQRQRIESLGRLNKLENENAELKSRIQDLEKDLEEQQELAKHYLEEQEKVLEIIKKRQVNIALLMTTSSVEEYNFYFRYEKIKKCLTEEEFDLLKRYFGNENI